MSRCVIIGAAEIKRYDRVNQALRKDDFCIFCDGGLYHLPYLNVEPDLITGDFDSHPWPETEVETIVLPREKYDTDTFFAVKEALRRGYDDFLLVGVAGGRLDHTLGNLSILLHLDSKGISARLIDDYSEMQIVSRDEAEVEDTFAYFSLLNISGIAKGVKITGAKYTRLENEEITCDYAYAISNEVLPGQKARISLQEGRLLLIKVYAK